VRRGPVSRTPNRVPLVHAADLSAEQRELYDQVTGGPRKGSLVPMVDDRGRLLGPFGLMLFTPGIGAAVQELGAALRFKGDLAPTCRELAILTIAAELQSEFEWLAHVGQAVACGVTESVLEQLLADEPADLSEPVERCVVSTTRALARRRLLTDAEYVYAVDTLGVAGLAELTWLCGYYMMLALALEVFSPPLPD
jgi:alkylhydroperoxidase family enzyme